MNECLQLVKEMKGRYRPTHPVLINVLDGLDIREDLEIQKESFFLGFSFPKKETISFPHYYISLKMPELEVGSWLLVPPDSQRLALSPYA